MSMRWMICLLIILLGGCHGGLPLDRTTSEVLPPIMPLWERYQQCLVTTDPAELLLIIDQLERVVPAGTTPPSWMMAWSRHVMSQPLRTSVDPQTLSASCTLRAAAVMAEAEQLTEARALYQRVIERYAQGDRVYYVGQATDALASLEAATPAVIALRSRSTPSH